MCNIVVIKMLIIDFSTNLYRNTLYSDAALKSKNLEISACIKHALWITVLMSHIKS